QAEAGGPRSGSGAGRTTTTIVRTTGATAPAIRRGSAVRTDGTGNTATVTGATDAFVGGATPTQLCLMLSRVASRCSTCWCARASVGTRTRAVTIVRTATRRD